MKFPGEIPRGIEVLVKKASVDPEFKTFLLTERAKAAERIGLELDPAETLMIGAVPDEQLETIIAHTTVPQQHRRAFLGHAATAMLAAVGFMAAGCVEEPAVTGIRPEPIPAPNGIRPDLPPEDPPPVSTGSRSDPVPPKPDPDQVTLGIRPDRIPVDRSQPGVRRSPE